MNKKIIILGTIAIGTIITATVVPIVLLNKNEEKIEKDNVIYANKLKALKTKIVTISGISGDVTTNKNIILDKIKSLNNFPKLPKGITLDVKDSSEKLTISGVAIILIVKKEGETDIEIKDFKVKRLQSDQEIVDNYATKLNALKIKEVTIDATSGSVDSNNDEIKQKIKSLNNFPTLPNDVILEIKESPIKVSILGVAIDLLIKKGSITKEIRGFRVKRSKSNQEIVDSYKTNLLAAISQKDRTIKIDATSGTITSKKVDIINKIERIKGFIAKPTGVSLEVKDDPTQITLEGTLITLVIKKDSTKIEIGTSENFKVKRSESNQEIVDNYKTNLLAAISQKDRTIKIDATSGTITSKKVDIINKIEKIEGFVAKPTGVSLEVKDDPTQITTEGILITLVIKKDSTKTEIRASENFKVKRSKSNQEVVDNYKTNLLAAISQKDRTIKIDATSGTITSKKVDIINKIEKIEGFIAKPAGVIFEVKDDSTEITPEGTLITLVIKKDSAETEIGIIEEFKVKRSLSSQEIVNDYASKLSSISNEIIVPISSLGTITEKKNDILNAIKGLSNFPELPDDLILDIKDSNLELTTTSVEVILIIKKAGVSDKEVRGFTIKRVRNDQESIDIYKNLLLGAIKAENRIVKIDDTSGTITSKKNDIIKKIEETKGFISKPEGVSLEVEDDPTQITTEGISITLVIKKGSAKTKIGSNIADPFKVKRSKTPSELAFESVNNVKRILDEKPSKIVTITNLQAKVEASGVANKIKAKVEEQIGSDDLDGVIITISADSTNQDILDTGEGVGFKITLSKGDATLVGITNWKVKREKTQNEKDIDRVKAIFDGINSASKIITITNLQAKVEASGVANKIKAKVEEQIGSDDLDGVIITISADSTNADILDTGNGVGFIIVLSKGDAPPVEITDWKVKREKTQDEKDIDEVKGIFDGVTLTSKIVTITIVQSKVDAPSVSTKIVEALKVKIVEDNLKDVTINVKPNVANADILDTGNGVGFIIVLSKGEAPPVEITDWKVKRNKTLTEINNDSIRRVIAILNSKSSKVVTITSLEAKMESLEVKNKIKAEIIKQIGKNNLEGVKIIINSFASLYDDLLTGVEIPFVILIDKKPSNKLFLRNWKVRREKIQDEKDIDSIKAIFDEQSSKIVTITNFQTKVDTPEANAKIVNALKAKINQTNLKGVTISVKPDSTNADIIDTGLGIGFIITLSKGEAPPVEITDWKVKRIKTLNERNDDSISKVFGILNLKSSKVVTIINLQAKVGAIGVADKIKAKVEEQIGIENLDGVKVSISAADANEDILDTGEGVSFIITLSKGEFSSATINNWKVKREKTANESIVSVSNILKNKSSKIISIPLGNDLKIDDNAQIIAKIKIALEKEVGINNLKNVIITPSKDSANGIITTSQQGIGFKITISKDDGTPIIINNWKVRRKEFTEAESIDWVKFILDSKMFKLIKINNSQAKVGDQGVANKIKIALEEKIGLNNLEGITISISADTENEDIINSGQGIGFIITLSKGSAQSAQITNWKVRLKTSQEAVDDYVNQLKKLSTKRLVIKVDSGSINDHEVKIINEIKKLNNLPDGLILDIKEDSTLLTVEGVPITLIVKKTGIKNQEITGFKVSRFPPYGAFAAKDKIVNLIKAFLNKQSRKIITIDSKELSVNFYDKKITSLIKKKIDIINSKNFNWKFVNPPIELVKPDSNYITTTGIGFAILFDIGHLGTPRPDYEIKGWKVKINKID